MATDAALGLGGNLGDPVAAFAAAIDALAAHPGVAVKALSSVYRTPPWGKLDQPEFLNMAVLLETTLAPDELLGLCLAVEQAQGRERLERWGPRTLDIDILTFGDEAIDLPGLQIPHPRLAERAFALVPLAEIAPAQTISGATVESFLSPAGRKEISADSVLTERLRSMVGG